MSDDLDVLTLTDRRRLTAFERACAALRARNLAGTGPADVTAALKAADWILTEAGPTALAGLNVDGQEVTVEPGHGAMVEVAGRRIVHIPNASMDGWRIITGPTWREDLDDWWGSWEDVRALGPVTVLVTSAAGGAE